MGDVGAASAPAASLALLVSPVWSGTFPWAVDVAYTFIGAPLSCAATPPDGQDAGCAFVAKRYRGQAQAYATLIWINTPPPVTCNRSPGGAKKQPHRPPRRSASARSTAIRRLEHIDEFVRLGDAHGVHAHRPGQPTSRARVLEVDVDVVVVAVKAFSRCLMMR